MAETPHDDSSKLETQLNNIEKSFSSLPTGKAEALASASEVLEGTGLVRQDVFRLLNDVVAYREEIINSTLNGEVMERFWQLSKDFRTLQEQYDLLDSGAQDEKKYSPMLMQLTGIKFELMKMLEKENLNLN